MRQDHPMWVDRPISPVQIVLEGGSMRNPFTCGILDFFMDQGFFAESVIGTSVGVMCGYNYVSGAPGRMIRIDLQYRSDWRFMSFRSKILTGNLIGLEFMCDTLPNEIEHFDHRWFSESPMTLTGVSTNLVTGRPDYHVFNNDARKAGDNGENDETGSKDCERRLSGCGQSTENPDRKREFLDREQKYIIASSALPYVNRPVHVDGKLLADGGVSDRIPFERGQAHYRGAQIVILTRSAEFEQSKTYDRYIAPVLYGKYPRFVERLVAREDEYPRLITRIENAHEAGDLFMIRPDHELGIGTIESDEDKLFAAYEAGLEKAAAKWDALQAFLGARLLR